MQNVHDIERGSRTTSLDAIGGEQLAGSGFGEEGPELGFSTTEEVEE
jgi:hypothetical protein